MIRCGLSAKRVDEDRYNALLTKFLWTTVEKLFLTSTCRLTRSLMPLQLGPPRTPTLSSTTTSRVPARYPRWHPRWPQCLARNSYLVSVQELLVAASLSVLQEFVDQGMEKRCPSAYLDRQVRSLTTWTTSPARSHLLASALSLQTLMSSPTCSFLKL